MRKVPSIRLVFGQDYMVAAWADRAAGEHFFPPLKAIGVKLDGELIGAAIYNNFNAGNVDLSVVAISPRACSRRSLRAMFHYPFKVQKVHRITAKTRDSNHRARRSLLRMGFKLEGRLREWFHGEDALIYGMLPQECKWLER